MFKVATDLLAVFLLGALLSFAAYADAPVKKTEPLNFSAAEIDEIMGAMAFVEGGSFTMGSDDADARNREKPAHQVSVDGFYIAKTEMTQKLFKRVMGWDVSYFQCESCPVNNISWMNIHAFLTKLSKATGRTFRLPTEAEWEFAAKGGNQSKDYAYSGSNNIDEVAWYAGNADRKSHPVGQKAPNELGLYDMTGNLWEFCFDDMRRRVYTHEHRINPVIDAGLPVDVNALKVTRGSGYEFDAGESKVYRRDGATSNVRMPDIGFRIAMDAQ